MKRLLSLTGRFLALVVLYVALWIVGTRLFPVTVPGPKDPAQAARAVLGLLVCGVVDTALLALWASRTRLTGWRRWAALSAAFYGTKTFSSQLEALWFMPNVTGSMAPSLFAMTLPLALLFPLAVVTAFGRKGPEDGPAWQAPAVPVRRALLDWAALSALVYPALFFLAGYFIAFRSPALRAFYGGYQGEGFFGHFAAVFAADPSVGPFEAFRGLLWIALMLPLFRTSRGRWWVDAILVGAFLALVQNDVHLLPNGFMTAEIRLYHFLETASSNFVWGLAMVFMLRGRHEGSARRQAARAPAPGGGAVETPARA